MPTALANLQKAKYTMVDIRDRKDPRTFIQDIIWHTKAANLTSVQNQLTIAWNNLDLEFYLHIAESTLATIIRKFLKELDRQLNMQHELAYIKKAYRSSSKRFYSTAQATPSTQRKTSLTNNSISLAPKHLTKSTLLLRQ